MKVGVGIHPLGGIFNARPREMRNFVVVFVSDFSFRFVFLIFFGGGLRRTTRGQ